MIGTTHRAGIIVGLILALSSAYLWAKCAVSWVEVHGRVECSFKPDDKVLVALFFSKHQAEGTGEETALDIREGFFQGRVVFDRFSSSHFLTADRCNRRPISVLIRLISADGGEQDRKMLKFLDEFTFVEKHGQYTLRSDLTLHGWCGPKCPEATSSPCQNPH
jgi:hypothetical protein